MPNSLRNEISDFLDWSLGSLSEARQLVDEEDLAHQLISKGYCNKPYSEFERALCCPVNKRREKYCGCTLCTSHGFCTVLRKEGYV